MKGYLTTGIIISIQLLSIFCSAHKPAVAAKEDDIQGIWLTQSKESMIEIRKSENNYTGRIFWLKFPISQYTHKPKVDIKNPDPKLRTTPIIGLNILMGFKYSPATKTGEGEIYDPKSGITYNCKATLLDANTLNIHGYIGAYWMGLGRTETWKRIKY